MTGSTTFQTPFGPCALAFTPQGISGLELPASPHEAPALVSSRMEARGARPAAPDARARDAAQRLVRFFQGEGDELAGVELDLSRVPDFHRRAYQALRGVGKGQLVSYRDLAERVGSPGAVRAIGQAMAKNPCPLLIPCHRVLAVDGKLGGFSAAGGLPVKARLLVLEGTRRPEQILAQADPILGRFIRQAGPFAPRTAPEDSIFVSLARAIVHQQLSGRAAEAIWGRVLALYPRGITQEAVRRTRPETLRGAGLSRSKTAAILDLAQQAIAGVVPEEPALASMSDEEIVSRLTRVRGVGPWSVEMLLIFRLGRLDVLPATDYGVRKGFQRLYGLGDLPTPRELLAHGERWRPYRSIASWYLWRALERLRRGGG